LVSIMIDPGHGGKDPGAVAQGLQEKHLTLDIARRVKRILEREYEGITVYMTRETDEYVSLQERADLANRLDADFFLSIHVNAGGGTGFESYRYTKSMPQSKVYQEIIHQEIVHALGDDVTDRGKKTQNFAVLRLTKMPALLTENLFIDNLHDAVRLKSESFLEKLARATAGGVAKAFKLGRINPAPSPEPKAKYRLLTGTFSTRQEAENAAATLRRQFGWTVYVVE